MEIELPQEFKEFLRFINANQVEYLLVGGYMRSAITGILAPRATLIFGSLQRLKTRPISAKLCLIEFGFSPATIANEFSLRVPDGIHIGLPPVRIDLLTSISGATFADCYSRRISGVLDGETAHIIDLADLRKNKQAAGRLKDLNDLEHLPVA